MLKNPPKNLQIFWQQNCPLPQLGKGKPEGKEEPKPLSEKI
jgi:hypothetical protein